MDLRRLGLTRGRSIPIQLKRSDLRAKAPGFSPTPHWTPSRHLQLISGGPGEQRPKDILLSHVILLSPTRMVILGGAVCDFPVLY